MEAKDHLLQLQTNQNKLKFREVKSDRTQVGISGSQIDALIAPSVPLLSPGLRSGGVLRVSPIKHCTNTRDYYYLL